jgi:hypothetical protein
MGPNHFTLNDGGAVCGQCGEKNPLGNLRRMSIQEVTEPSEIIVCFTKIGTIAHALPRGLQDGARSVGQVPTAETLEKALRYLGATNEQIEAHRATMRQTGQGSSNIRLLPNRKNLLRIDWNRL